jgi:hypothetical protein
LQFLTSSFSTNTSLHGFDERPSFEFRYNLNGLPLGPRSTIWKKNKSRHATLRGDEQRTHADPHPQAVETPRSQEGIRAGVRGDVPENGNEHRDHQQVIADKEDVFKRPGYSAADPRRKS